MTEGIWVCLKCGAAYKIPISMALTECPRCGAKYEVVEILQGAHIVHPIPVTRLEGTGLLNVPLPIGFAIGRNEKAVRKYFSLVRSVERRIKEMGKPIKPQRLPRSFYRKLLYQRLREAAKDYEEED